MEGGMKKLLLGALAGLMIPALAAASETWTRTYGSGLDALAYDVLLLEDGGYLIVGDTVTQYEPVMIGHLLLLRLDADGEIVWERMYGGDRSCSGQSVLATCDGGYMVAGTIESAPGSDLDVYLLCVDEDGTEWWSRSFGTPLDEVGGALLRAADGGYVIVGNSVDPNDVVADPGAAGYAGFAGRSNAYIVRTDEEGNEIWSRRYDTEDNVIASGGPLIRAAAEADDPTRSELHAFLLDVAEVLSDRERRAERGADGVVRGLADREDRRAEFLDRRTALLVEDRLLGLDVADLADEQRV